VRMYESSVFLREAMIQHGGRRPLIGQMLGTYKAQIKPLIKCKLLKSLALLALKRRTTPRDLAPVDKFTFPS
jgi:hypothetical protein